MKTPVLRKLLALTVLLAVGAISSSVALAQTQTTKPAQPTKKAGAKKSQPATAATTAPNGAPKREWHSVTVVHVRPDKVAEWEELQKNVVNPALKKAGLKHRDIWQTAVFGESFEYVVLTPIASLAQYDSPNPLRAALGEDGYRNYQTKSRNCVTSSHTYGIQSRPDLSYPGKMASAKEPPKMAIVNTIQIAPGRATEFEALVKSDVVAAMKKADVLGYFVNQTVFGGNANEFVSVLFTDNFADLDKGSPFVRALGEAGAQAFMRKFTGIVTHQERSISRYNADLSFYVAP